MVIQFSETGRHPLHTAKPLGWESAGEVVPTPYRTRLSQEAGTLHNGSYVPENQRTTPIEIRASMRQLVGLLRFPHIIVDHHQAQRANHWSLPSGPAANAVSRASDIVGGVLHPRDAGRDAAGRLSS
jgi:hypothetical protein